MHVDAYRGHLASKTVSKAHSEPASHPHRTRSFLAVGCYIKRCPWPGAVAFSRKDEAHMLCQSKSLFSTVAGV